MAYTDLMVFRPVPIATEIVESVMPVTIILLFCTSCCLILFSPTALNIFAPGFSGVRHIIECPKKLAKQNVIFDVHLQDSSADSRN